MSLQITDKEQKEIFEQVKHELGAPVIKIEIEDEQLISLLKVAIKDFAYEIQSWLVENQWSSLSGIDVNESDISKAFITRSMDFETKFTYAYSKIVGLQANGPWQLKKDFVVLEDNKQIYEIPVNRELNEVLWITPPDLTSAVLDPYFGGFAQGAGGAMDYGTFNQFYVSPAYDILARAMDRNLKNRLIRSELVYKITRGENVKYLHLMPTPGGRNDFGISKFNRYKCWYWYYDTNDDNRDQCLKENKDIIKSFSDVPLETITYSDLNSIARHWVYKILLAKTKYTIGMIRAKTSGSIKISKDNEINMEYSSLLSDAKEELNNLKTELKEYLSRMTNEKMLERKANEAENLNKTLLYRPFKRPLKYI